MHDAPSIPARPIALVDVPDAYPISESALRKWMRTGRVTAWRFGGKKLYLDRDELDAMFVVASR
ncbi:hypothetical protein [Sinomonas albida]|uniref:hypothetical protein n=1 Tax=Sinomonas albida TaxID=369942 RepID=UPI003019FB7A